MSESFNFDLENNSPCKIELHVHLDGSVRPSTIWDLAKKKGIDLGYSTLEELIDALTIKSPSTLAEFLKPFSIYTPLIRGDKEAIERIAYEFCEDSAKQNVLYTEVRYSPHLLSTILSTSKDYCLTPREVIIAVNNGLLRGSSDFGIKVRSILCCIRGYPEWSKSVLDFCLEFQPDGVVGIDMAGDEASILASPSDMKVFLRAAELGVHRTVHAGEAGPAANVLTAVNEMKAERIGHGYHVLEDLSIYSSCLEQNVHFETCPYSSVLTGSVPESFTKHPILSFAEDDANFSISRDDPTIIQKSLDQEYDKLRNWGLRDMHIFTANCNAVRSSFLPESEKNALLLQLLKSFGVSKDEIAAQIFPSITVDNV